MDKAMGLTTLASAALLALGLGSGAQAQQSSEMTFFVTSAGPGNGADLGGLEGADQHCQQLAEAVGAGGRTWRAYLSTQAAGGEPAINARDRIGQGPWQNAEGVVIASSLEELHDTNNLNKDTGLTEQGERRQRPRRQPEQARYPDGLAAGRYGVRASGGPDLRQLDAERRRRGCHGRPP